jgi:O-antigen/teichoic acid export membrane protein
VNVLSNWIGQAVSISLSFFVTPFIITRLGDSAYGVWVLMAAIAGYLGLLDLGVRGAVSRYVARFAAAGDDHAASRSASSAVQIFSAMGAVAFAVSLSLALLALDRLGVSAADRPAARVVLALVGFNVAVSLVSGTWAGTVAALQRFDRLNLVEVVIGVVRTGAIAAAILGGHGIIAMALIQLAMSIVRGIWLAALTRRLYPALHLNLRSMSREHMRMIFAFSVLSFLIHISGRLIYYTDALVIASFLPVGLLTFYSIGAGLVDSARMLVSGVSITTSPMASSLEGAGEHERIRALLLTSANYSMMILLPIAVTFIVRGQSFIGLWIGPSHASQAGEVLAVLALPLFFHAGAHGAGGIVIGAGRHRPMVPAMMIEGGANLALSLWLIPTMGIVGVAWGTTIPSIVSSLLFWPWLARHALGIPVASYVETIWIRPWIAAVPFSLGTYAAERLWPATTLMSFFVQVGLCVPLALAADWWVCLRAEERIAIASRLSAVRVLASTREV